jgi:hypothetical protein
MLHGVKSSYRVEIDALQRSLATAVAAVEPNKTARDQLDKEVQFFSSSILHSIFTT